MVMINIKDKTWYEEKNWLQNLDIYLDGMQENDDLVLFVDGPERAGKSFRIRQIAKYCANYLGTEFTDENVFFGLNEYIDFSLKSPFYTICVLDEGRNVLSRKSSMSKSNKKFTNYLSECGKKRQVHIIASPAYHDIDRYIIMWRAKGVVHLHKWYEPNPTNKSGYKLARGVFTFYMNDDYLKKCYDFPYSYPRKWEVKGNFSNVEVFSDEELKRYEEKKDVNMEKKYHSKYEDEEIGRLEKTWKNRYILLLEHFQNARGVTIGEIADASRMEVSTLKSHLQKVKCKREEDI